MAAFGRKVDLASSALAYCALTFASLIIFIQNPTCAQLFGSLCSNSVRVSIYFPSCKFVFSLTWIDVAN